MISLMTSTEPPLRSRRFAGATACIALASCMHAAASPTQCQLDEEQLFVCSTGTKMLAVCASRDWSASAGSLQYRYGTPAVAELVLPRVPTSPSASASAGLLMFSPGGGAYLRFANGATDYVVYIATSSKWGERSGVVVERGGRQMRSIPCKSAMQSKLGSELFTRAGFKSDEALFLLPE